MIKRFYQNLEDHLLPGKVLVIYGPRRIGKTTLLESYLSKTNRKYRLDSGDNIKIQQILSSQNFSKILEYAEGYNLIAIDEAQQIPNIGMGLKILVDQRPDLRVIATGSSSFDLSNQIGEPLTGRKRTLLLYPIAQLELLNEYNRFDLKQRLEEFLIYGSYPEVLTSGTTEKKRDILNELAHASLFKDILALEKVKGPHVLHNLLKLLAFQIGKQVAFHELARQLGMSVKTIQRYLDLLEKTFVLFHIGGFSRNLRSEVTRKNKYYFYDIGIRNALISQFQPLIDRNDAGELWENFLMVERMKKRSYHNMYASSYFWRTYKGQEIDLIEERGGKLYGYEFKWSKGKTRVPQDWSTHYPNASFEIINQANYLDFVT